MLQGLKAAGIVVLVLLGLFVLNLIGEVVPDRHGPPPPPPWESLRISTPPTVDEPTRTYVCRECPDYPINEPEVDRNNENNPYR